MTTPTTRIALFLAFALATTAASTGCGDDPTSVHQSVRRVDDASDAGRSDAGRSDAGSSDAGEAVTSDAGVGADAADYSRRSVFEAGPYRVGFRDFSLTYDAVGEQGREVRVAVWYPTTDTTGTKGRYANILGRVEVFADASVGIEAPMPMLVFSHGNGSLAEQSYFMSEFFASHGWIVASPDHTGNTFRENPGFIDLSSARLRPQDITTVIDAMLNRPADDPLNERVDAQQIVLAGHSFGGFTTLASAGATFAVDQILEDCQTGEIDPALCTAFQGNELDVFRDGFHDPRVKVAIPQTPAGARVYQEGLAGITIPTMLMTAGRDATLPNELEGDPIWAQLLGSQRHVRVDLRRGGHFTYSNLCDYIGSSYADDGCSDAFIDTALAYDIVNAYTLAFARHHLEGDDDEASALVSGADQPWPNEVTFSTR